jgi:hypothetical protein
MSFLAFMNEFLHQPEHDQSQTGHKTWIPEPEIPTAE